MFINSNGCVKISSDLDLSPFIYKSTNIVGHYTRNDSVLSELFIHSQRMMKVIIYKPCFGRVVGHQNLSLRSSPEFIPT